MTSQDFIDETQKWINWVASNPSQDYDIALFKIWIQFEKFVSEIFFDYCLAIPSETGYCPSRKITFTSKDQLDNIFRKEGQPYTDFFKLSQNKSKWIFDDNDNPFISVFNSVNYSPVITSVNIIRDYIAHESGQAKSKYISKCLNGRSSPFVSPRDFLAQMNVQQSKTQFTIYVEALIKIILFLIDPY